MNVQPRIVALLPMKAHSSRVSGKNFRPFAGKPLFRWILDTLLDLEAIQQIVINTDARDILERHGLVDGGKVLIRDRKSDLCGDFVSMNRILEDDISAVEADCYLMTHTTNPLLSESTIRRALAELLSMQETHDSLFSVNRYQTRFYRADGSPINHDPNNLIRTQDLEVWYEENSNFYLFTRQSFASTSARIGRHPILFETPPLESVDIDDHTNWHMAEVLALSKMLVKTALDFTDSHPE